MWQRAIVALALLFVAALGVQILISRNRARNVPSRQYAMWDVAPVTGFLGAVLLVLSFTEATRREAIDAWRWGIAFGFIVSACLGAVVVYRRSQRAPRIANPPAPPSVAVSRQGSRDLRSATDPAGPRGAFASGKGTAARTLLSFVRAYGVGFLFAILAVTLAVRLVGATLGVFVAGALGTFAVAGAVAVFSIAWRNKSIGPRRSGN